MCHISPQEKQKMCLILKKAKSECVLSLCGVTVRTVWAGLPWKSGGLRTAQMYVPLSVSEAFSSWMEASPRDGLPSHFTRSLK